MAIARVLFRQALLLHSDPLFAIRSTHQVRSPFKLFISVSSSSGNGGGGDCRRSNSYLKLSDEELMAQCEMDTYKASGPGGQHRNKRESAVRLKHLPTGVIAQAVEDRSQHKNRAAALSRLRSLLALKGMKLTWMNINLLLKSFRSYLQNRQSGEQMLVHKLVLRTQSLLWVCKLYWICFLLLKVQYQRQQKDWG